MLTHGRLLLLAGPDAPSMPSSTAHERRFVAHTVIERFIKEDSVIAFGHGGLANAVIEALAAQRQQGRLKVRHRLS